MNIFDTDITKVPVIEDITREQFEKEIRPVGRPVILRGLVKDWPAVKAGEVSAEEIGRYIKSMDSGRPVSTYIGQPEIQGRYFYSNGMQGFNFERRNIPLTASVDKLLSQAENDSPLGVYAGATSAVDVLPEFSNTHPMPLVDEDVPPLLWLGNSACIATHFDTSENIACSVAGKRRFLIFPPDQIGNLYIGPLDHNMAGPPASLVDPKNVDLKKFPKFKMAMPSALLAELEAGDALYLPSLWWHYVESMGLMNVLVNYWWSTLSNNAPMSNIALALLTLRDLPAVERTAWRHYFDHFIFGESAQDSFEHIPENIRGVLGVKSPERDNKIKQFLISRLRAMFN